jgi:hypothetical protein
MKNPNPDPARPADIPVWNAENWMYEDIVIGHRIRSIRRTLSEGECMQFNALVLDMLPYVADEIFAKEEGIFGRRLVAGAMVFGVGLGLVATNCVNAFRYGSDNHPTGFHRRHHLHDQDRPGKSAQIRGDGPLTGELRGFQKPRRARALLRASADREIPRPRCLRGADETITLHVLIVQVDHENLIKRARAKPAASTQNP